MTPLELASGIVVGRASCCVTATIPAVAPIHALENAVRPALRRGTCLVSFSGGHDSSLVLAVATRVARAEGLPLPIPITWRFVNAPRAEESQLQDDVVSALGLRDWIRLTADDELDYVGPIAQQVLRRHGPLFPANAFLHGPMLARAAGGTLLTGVGGDQLFTRTRRPRRPWPVASRHGRHEGFPWLRPVAAGAAFRHLAREDRRMPADPARRPRWRVERRSLELLQQSLRVIARDVGAIVEHPLLDGEVVGAVEGFGVSPNAADGRPALLGRMFAEHLPPACLLPRRKALINEVFWNRHARDHIDTWDGSGVDETIVDVAGLRAWWQRDQPMMYTALLLQQTWLANDATRAAARAGQAGSG